MRKPTSEMIAVALVLITTIGVLGATLAYRAKTKPEIELLARSPEKGNWSPQTITVERGKEVTIGIRNEDAVTHGFYVPAFDIAVREIKAGTVERVKFIPNSAGEYTFFCNVWCSDYHMQMRGKLIVKE